MSFTTTLRSAASLASGALLSSIALASTALAQGTTAHCASWDKTGFDPNGQLHIEGFLVAQEGALGVEVFSASARKWNFISPPGSGVVGSGDFCLLVREPTGMRAYSSRLNNSAFLPFLGGALPIVVASDDDVALVIGFDNSGLLNAWGYSAVHGVWVPQPVGAGVTASDFVISRFVAGVRSNNLYHGFAARTGAWSTHVGPIPGAPMKADGNTLMADFTGFTPGPILAAFSGVRGCWSPSPLLIPAAPHLLDHNVLYGRVPVGPGVYRGCAYSAYSAAWSVGTLLRSALTLEAISDNVVLLEDPNFLGNVEAFGAGHSTWNALPGPWRSLHIDEDYVTAVQGSGLNFAGFSGVCGGPWVPEPNPSTAFPTPVLAPDHIGAIDTGISLHVFQPTLNTWALPMPKSPLDTVIVADAVIELAQPGVNWAISTRWANWIASPPLSPFTVGTGSVIAHQDPAGTVDIYDERCDMWNAPYALSAPSPMIAGRNLVVTMQSPTTAAAQIEAYSVQRGDWTTPGSVPLPLAVLPIAEENVATFVDAGGVLWAYGSPNDGHSYFQWPNDTEYHVSQAAGLTPACTPVLLGIGVRSAPGNFSMVLLGNTIQCPPLVLPGYCGELWLPVVGTSIYTTLGFHDPDCMLEFKATLPYTLPGCLQPWIQPLTFDFASGMLCFGCRRSDPAWVF